MGFALSLLLLLLSAGLAWAQQAAADRAPNIVFVMADDLGWSQIYDSTSTFYETPEIDTLARQGVAFRAAYASAPICSPTRGALMSGQYPARTHVTDWIPGFPDRDNRLEVPDWQPFLPLSVRTMAEALQGAGYATGYFGKWHLSPAKKPPESRSHNPNRQGFEETFITYKPKPPIIRPWQGAEDDAHSTDMLTGHALRFIEDHTQRCMTNGQPIHVGLKPYF